MNLEPKPPAFHEIADPEQRLAAFFKWAADYCAEQQARNPAPDRPPEPWVDKPGTLIAAEKDLICAELNHVLVSRMCPTTDRCQDRRCRRSRRCREIAAAAAGIEEARACLDAERAKWQPPPTPVEPRRMSGRQR